MKNKKKPHPFKNAPVLSLKDIANTFEGLNPQDATLSSYDDFEEFFDFEESLKRHNKEYKIEVNWGNYNEPQIQALIAILFHTIGYFPENLHKADRAREEGADLVLKRGKHNIAIAVKIKPKNADRQQLSDLSKRTEQRRIYVYTQTPSGKFRESMSEYDGIVEFWNREKLNGFFVSKNLGFTVSLIFDDNDLSDTTRQVQSTLLRLRQKCLKLNTMYFQGQT